MATVDELFLQALGELNAHLQHVSTIARKIEKAVMIFGDDDFSFTEEHKLAKWNRYRNAGKASIIESAQSLIDDDPDPE